MNYFKFEFTFLRSHSEACGLLCSKLWTLRHLGKLLFKYFLGHYGNSYSCSSAEYCLGSLAGESKSEYSSNGKIERLGGKNFIYKIGNLVPLALAV